MLHAHWAAKNLQNIQYTGFIVLNIYPINFIFPNPCPNIRLYLNFAW